MLDPAAALEALLAREGTGISWAHLTFNPWIGCQKVSPACDHCYAETLATQRLGVTWGPGAERRPTADSTWAKPWRWDRVVGKAGVKLRVFCASLADWADNAVPDAWRDRLANLISGTPNLIWMMLTKRIGNARAMLERMFPEGVPPNVWLGITVVNQPEVDRDVPRAIAVKRALRISRLFLSCEPLLGPLDLWRWLERDAEPVEIDLVIVGGESGRDARAMHPVWPLEIGHQCWSAAVAFHFKQWGEYVELTEPLPLPATAKEGARAVDIVRFRDGVEMVRVGTAKAGRTLAGREWLEVPA